MGRELKRVPLDFNWPLNKVWKGFINPHYSECSDCPDCGGGGYSPRAKLFNDQWYGNSPFDPVAYGAKPLRVSDSHLRECIEQKIERSIEIAKRDGKREGFTEGGTLPMELAVDREIIRMYSYYISQWGHHLIQEDVDALIEGGRLVDLTRHNETVTADMVNAWSLFGMGHDAINQWVCVKARCKREGVPDSCERCDGEGAMWSSPEAKEIAENWEEEQPPEGDGYQVWETVSEGSPVTPVFKTPEELARHLVANDDSVTKGTTFEQWMHFISGPGWAPSMVSVNGQSPVSGVQAVSQN